MPTVPTQGVNSERDAWFLGVPCGRYAKEAIAHIGNARPGSAMRMALCVTPDDVTSRRWETH